MIRRLDENGDWTFGSGKGAYIEKLEGLKLRLQTQLKEWKGDCFFALNRGIDWHLADKRENLILTQIRNTIMGNRDVLAINNVYIEKTKNRSWKPSMDILHIYDKNFASLDIIADGAPPQHLPPKFLIKVINGHAKSVAAAAGSVVTIIADEREGYVFSHWESVPQVVFTYGSDETSNPAYFIMPNGMVTITAVFVEFMGNLLAQDGRRLISQDSRYLIKQET